MRNLQSNICWPSSSDLKSYITEKDIINYPYTQDAVYHDNEIYGVAREYKLPQFWLLSTKVLQQQELELLRKATVSAQRAIEEEKKRIKAMINSFTPPHNSGNTFHNSSLNPSSSPNPSTYNNLIQYGLSSIAEQTLSTHRSN